MEAQMARHTLPQHFYLVECFDYDPDTGVLRWKIRPERHFKWNRRVFRHVNNAWAGQEAGVIFTWSTGLGAYRRVMLNGRYWQNHRIIWKLMTCFDPKEDIDHIDGDGLNNRWNNLREATKIQNGYNRRRWGKLHAHLPRGVTMTYKKGQTTRYVAKIRLNKELIYIGTYATPEEAGKAREAVARQHHGEFFRDDH
jgi:hypothetical protein